MDTSLLCILQLICSRFYMSHLTGWRELKKGNIFSPKYFWLQLELSSSGRGGNEH